MMSSSGRRTNKVSQEEDGPPLCRLTERQGKTKYKEDRTAPEGGGVSGLGFELWLRLLELEVRVGLGLAQALERKVSSP